MQLHNKTHSPTLRELFTQFTQCCLALALSGLCASAQAQVPGGGRPIHLIVPYAAGGPLDVTARVLAEKVRDALGVVVVENKPGAGGNIGADAVAKAAPDGLTIGIAATATHAVNPWLYTKMPYNAATDFAPITLVARVPNVLVVNAEFARRLKIDSVNDLIAYARANPAKLNYGSGGNGSAGHLAGEMFKRDAHVFAVHIPYNGANPAQLALLGAQVDFNFDNLASAAPNIRSGKLKALAVTTPHSIKALPGVPPVADTLKGFAIDTWWGLVAPAGTPKEVIHRLNQAFVAALQADETRSRFATLMAEPATSTPEEFAALMQSERAKYESLVKTSGARVD